MSGRTLWFAATSIPEPSLEDDDDDDEDDDDDDDAEDREDANIDESDA